MIGVMTSFGWARAYAILGIDILDTQVLCV